MSGWILDLFISRLMNVHVTATFILMLADQALAKVEKDRSYDGFSLLNNES
jgi:hypothetical protein